MALLSSLIHLVQPHVRGCPEPLIVQALLRAARRFASQTRVLRETVVLDVEAGQSYYPLVPADANEEALSIKATAGGVGEIGGVSLRDQPLRPASPEEVPPGTGAIYCFWFEPTMELVVMNTPTISMEEALAVRIIRIPKKDVMAVADDLLHDTNDQHIAAGALGELLLMPGAWKDPQMASVHINAFNAGVSTQRHKSDMQYRPYAFRSRPGLSEFIR